MVVGERELLYLCSAVIQSLAALLGITLIAYGLVSEAARRLKLELYNLAQTWWMRANMTPADMVSGHRPDVSRHTTIGDAPAFLKRNLKSIRESRHNDIANDVEEKLKELETTKRLTPLLFRRSIYFSFFGLSIATIVLIFASELNNNWGGFIFAVVIIILFLISVVSFIELIIRILGLGTSISSIVWQYVKKIFGRGVES